MKIVFMLTAVAVGLFSAFAISVLFKNKSNISIMLLGIAVTIAGGIFAIDPDANLGGIEYIIVLLGLSLTVGGFVKKEN